MPKNKKNKAIRNYRKKQLIIFAFIFMCSLAIVLTLARFVTNKVENYFIRSKEFYFNSDKLSEDMSVFQINNWSGVDSYQIIVDMNSVKNGLKSATYDIGYNISYNCSSNIICQLDKTSGTIYSSTNHDSFVLTLTPNVQLSTGDSVWVEITATSTGQYKKTLKGKFTLVVGKEDLTYQITDSENSPYLNLRITNTSSYYNARESFDTYNVGDKIDADTYKSLTEINQKKCYSAIVNLSFEPRNILLDMTDANYLVSTNVLTDIITTVDSSSGTDVNINNTYIKGFTINIAAVSSVDIRFYKVDVTQDYTYPLINDTSIIDIESTV